MMIYVHIYIYVYKYHPSSTVDQLWAGPHVPWPGCSVKDPVFGTSPIASLNHDTPWLRGIIDNGIISELVHVFRSDSISFFLNSFNAIVHQLLCSIWRFQLGLCSWSAISVVQLLFNARRVQRLVGIARSWSFWTKSSWPTGGVKVGTSITKAKIIWWSSIRLWQMCSWTAIWQEEDWQNDGAAIRAAGCGFSGPDLVKLQGPRRRLGRSDMTERYRPRGPCCGNLRNMRATRD